MADLITIINPATGETKECFPVAVQYFPGYIPESDHLKNLEEAAKAKPQTAANQSK